jgi:1-acyl-sn-glycerol-3-phosphate acyltransferase
MQPIRFRGSRLAAALLKLAGWKVLFEGLPARQGVLIVYPHTSNWDFVVGILAKWAIGLPVMFWGKDKLFRVPAFGAWLRWVGGVPVDRTSPQGVTKETLRVFEDRKAKGDYFWLALAPEGTRKHIPGLRSGFYRTALGADVPLGLVSFDYGAKQVRVLDFIRLTGDEAADMARIAQSFEGVRGCKPSNAAPIRLLDRAVARTDTIVK